VKFRTKIWMLPISATLVFLVGIAISYLVGARTLSALNQLRQVDAPALQQLRLVDQGVEQFRLLLQAAAAEGDADKLKEVEASVERTRAVLKALSAIDGKSGVATVLQSAFHGYQDVALQAARAMLARADSAEHVKRMQSAQARLDAVLKRDLADAVARNEMLQAQAAGGVQTALAVTLAIGLVVLLVLGCASTLVIRSVWRDLGEEPATLRALTHRIAEGDLQLDGLAGKGDGRSLNDAIAAMARRLRDTVGTIRDASQSIATATSEIAAGNSNLSARTEASASNLQQTAASIAQLNVTVRESADTAHKASQLAGVASEAAQRGGTIVAQVVSNMQEISVASRQIGEIIAVIDGIAFQTNILALNAAVEAARAGDQGRGFAVVAGEVRNLAQRSAGAAREIKDLITRSREKVEGGARLVQEAGDVMGEIVGGVQRVNAMIGDISTQASAQAAGIGEVHRAVDELDTMTQQNSALVEEAAAAANSMGELADRLQRVVDAFRVGEQRPAAGDGDEAPAQSLTGLPYWAQGALAPA
jgi:methyl-accepting chemotaxis protein